MKNKILGVIALLTLATATYAAGTADTAVVGQAENLVATGTSIFTMVTVFVLGVVGFGILLKLGKFIGKK